MFYQRLSLQLYSLDILRQTTLCVVEAFLNLRACSSSQNYVRYFTSLKHTYFKLQRSTSVTPSSLIRENTFLQFRYIQNVPNKAAFPFTNLNLPSAYSRPRFIVSFVYFSAIRNSLHRTCIRRIYDMAQSWLFSAEGTHI